MSAFVFTNVSIFDGTGAPLYPGEVRVEDTRIKAIGKGEERVNREGAQVIDGQKMTLMPGLVEAHSHLTFPSAVDRIVKGPMPPTERHELITAHNAKVLLDYGFTSAYSGGATRPAIEVAIRDEINGGWIPGPRIKASSFESGATGERETYQPSVEQARQFAQDMIALGVDSMKILLDGHSPTDPEHWHLINYGDAELEVITKLAREAGVNMSGHAYTPAGIKLGLKYNFRVMYHCNFADEEALDMIEARKSQMFLAPCVGILMADAYDRFSTRAEAEAIGAFRALEGQRQVIPELRKRGVRVLPGGDYGFPHNPHGRNGRDLELFVTQFGFEPAEVLHAATQLGGQLMGMENELGLVGADYLADLLLVNGDPIKDIKLFQNRDNIAMIMKNGSMYKPLSDPRSNVHRIAAE